MATYPKVLYHEDGRTTIARNLSEQNALGAEWYETPANFARGSFSVTADTVAKTLVPANASRQSLKMVNDATGILKIKYGTGASPTSFTWLLDPGDRWEMPQINGVAEYTGIISGIWTQAGGAVRIQELP